ncbi:hypothetical protein K8R03_00475 [Candidatus Kaiserbacteria bacterium]|nr:hypothetical protein [Candidatus Kaiserbacteria bacterium]
MRLHRHFARNSIPLSETLEAWLFVASIVLAVVLIKSDSIAQLVAHTKDFGAIGSFIEGFFFTSMLSTVTAIAAILETARFVPAWELALVGGFGAVCGDLMLFRFVRSRLVEHILKAALSPGVRRFGRAVAAGPFFWLGPVCGALVIASPLPDELGLLMMGLSHIRLGYFILIAFVANAGGIYLMALAVQSTL